MGFENAYLVEFIERDGYNEFYLIHDIATVYKIRVELVCINVYSYPANKGHLLDFKYKVLKTQKIQFPLNIPIVLTLKVQSNTLDLKLNGILIFTIKLNHNIDKIIRCRKPKGTILEPIPYKTNNKSIYILGLDINEEELVLFVVIVLFVICLVISLVAFRLRYQKELSFK